MDPADGSSSPLGVSFTSRPSSWNNISLRVWKWHPKENQLRALVFVAHGIGEYMGRYVKFGQELADNGILVFGHDHVGHGRSEGDRVHVETFNTYVLDIVRHIEDMKSEHPGVPCFLMGHSMGGLIASLVAVQIQDLLAGIIFSSASVDNAGLQVKKLLAKSLALLCPQLGLIKLDTAQISSIPEEVKLYQTDPQVYHSPLKVKWAAEFMCAIEAARERISEITIPALIFHGTEDGIVPFSASEFINTTIRSSDKTFEAFESNFHEVLHDQGQQRARELVKDWIIAHIE